MKITIDRIKHSLSVATKMKELATTDQEKYQVNPDDAFLLGMLHDVGYEFSEEQKEHASKGGLILKEQNYKYWQEVFYHGVPQDEYDSPMLRLLNYVDMITGPTGEYMTIRERINDITKRYGKGSWQEQKAIELSKVLSKNNDVGCV